MSQATPLIKPITNAALARTARADRRAADARAEYYRQFVKRRLLYVATLRDLASAAAAEGERLGYDGRPPEIVDAPGPGDNPQMRVARNVAEHPLDLMWHKRQITREQFAAGEMLRRDLELAMISPMTGRGFENIYNIELSNKAAVRDAGLSEMLGPKTFVPKAGKTAMTWRDMSDVTLDAQDRGKRARAAVAESCGPMTADILEAFLREGRTVQQIAAMKTAAGTVRFGARNSVGRKLQEALHALSLHYGLTHRARGQSAWVQPFHASEDDFNSKKGERV